MVSSINSVRLWSQQAALAAFKDASNGPAAGSNASSSSSSAQGSVTSLADVLFAGTSNSNAYEDPHLTALMTSLQQAMHGGAATDQADGSVDDISSKAFMKALGDKLAALKANPDTAAMADKMQKALDAGTLTITNAVSGEKITGYNAAKAPTAGTQATGTTATGTQTPAKATTIDKTDWTTFLKDMLTRDAGGKFVKNSDSSYSEKQGGASGYFGMVADQYYYISWTNPTTKPADAATPATTTG